MSIRVNDTWSPPLPVFGGVPQGSILGVLLFNVSVDDLEDHDAADEREFVYTSGEETGDGSSDVFRGTNGDETESGCESQLRPPLRARRGWGSDSGSDEPPHYWADEGNAFDSGELLNSSHETRWGGHRLDPLADVFVPSYPPGRNPHALPFSPAHGESMRGFNITDEVLAQAGVASDALPSRFDYEADRNPERHQQCPPSQTEENCPGDGSALSWTDEREAHHSGLHNVSSSPIGRRGSEHNESGSLIGQRGSELGSPAPLEEAESDRKPAVPSTSTPARPERGRLRSRISPVHARGPRLSARDWS